MSKRRVMMIDLDKFTAAIDAEVDYYKAKAATENTFTASFYTSIAVAMNKTAEVMVQSAIVEDWD